MGSDYDDGILQGVKYWHWLQIKILKTICNYDTETKKGQYGYNLSYKFYQIWWFLIHNINFLTKHVELDTCGDETIRETSIYVEAGAGIIGQISNKPSIINDEQTVHAGDVHCIRTCAYKPDSICMLIFLIVMYGEYWGEVNNGSAESDGGSRGGVLEKHILWIFTLNMGNYFSGDQITN